MQPPGSQRPRVLSTPVVVILTAVACLATLTAITAVAWWLIRPTLAKPKTVAVKQAPPRGPVQKPAPAPNPKPPSPPPPSRLSPADQDPTGSLVRAPDLPALLVSLPRFTAEWPQLLGPTRDAVYAGPALAEDWPPEGPAVVWSADVGEGYSSPVVAEGLLVICHRLGNDLLVDCLHPKTGQRLWRFTHPMDFSDNAHYDSGPRPTPAIKDGRVFVYNTDGYLVCLDLRQGEKIWSRHPKSEFQSSATWHGCVGSPLLTEKAVILPVGGQAAAVAFAQTSGEILWQGPPEKVSASSPVPAILDGEPRVLLATRSYLECLDPANGRLIWRMPTRGKNTANVYAASPIISGDHILLCAWYGLGAQWIHVQKAGAEPVWSRNDALSTHFANPVLFEGHAYGFHGHAVEMGGPNLRCIELASGNVAWEQPKFGAGTLVRAGENLLILAERGELLLAKASPKEFKVKARAQITSRTTRSYPALADGYLFVKGPRKLICLDLRSKKEI